jgi:hypothetical protein
MSNLHTLKTVLLGDVQLQDHAGRFAFLKNGQMYNKTFEQPVDILEIDDLAPHHEGTLYVIPTYPTNVTTHVG